MKQLEQKMRAGFTIMEVMIAVMVIGLLASGAAVGISKMMKKANLNSARSGVQAVASAMKQYKMDNGKYPSDLKELIKEDEDGDAYLDGGEGSLEDPWRNEYKLEWKGNGKRNFVIISAGDDGEFGTDDDVRSDDLKGKKKAQ